MSEIMLQVKYKNSWVRLLCLKNMNLYGKRNCHHKLRSFLWNSNKENHLYLNSFNNKSNKHLVISATKQRLFNIKWKRTE